MLQPQAKSKCKGISVAKGGVVCLLQNYCPFCFKGKPGVSRGIKVKKGSPLIDELQAMHAANRNGLCPLDFKQPGDFCTNHALCKMVCLVCGKAMVDGEDPEFELFLDAFGGYSSEEEIDVATNHEVKVVMKSLGLVWTEHWSTPIHKACSKKAACKCVVALGATFCPRHQWPVERKTVAPESLWPPKAKREVAPKKTQIEETSSTLKKPAASALVAAPVMHNATAKARMIKADWLPPPSMTASTVHVSSVATGGAGASKKDVPEIRGKNTIVPKQPVKTVKTVRLEQAAATCAYKIDSWTAEHPTNKKLGGPVMAQTSKDSGTHAGKKFSLEDHYRLFDPNEHGWRKINGVKGFMHYNGVFIPTDHDVICIHEDGTITPG